MPLGGVVNSIPPRRKTTNNIALLSCTMHNLNYTEGLAAISEDFYVQLYYGVGCWAPVERLGAAGEIGKYVLCQV